MKTLVKRTILFCILFLIIATILDIAISSQLRKVYYISGENEVWNDIYDHKVTDPCLIYGSSRAKVHIDPMMIEELTGISAYNFGQDGQTFNMQELRHRIQVKENGYPKYIIHSMDAFTLAKTEEIHNKQQFLPYLLWNFEMIKSLEQYTGFSYLDYFVPLARFYGNYEKIKDAIREPFFPNTTFEREKGYRQEERGWTDDFDRAKEQMDKYRIDINVKTRELYESFIEECKGNNVALAMIYTPEHIWGQEFIANRDSIVSIYKEISEKHNISFIDYTTDTICYDQQYFYNTMHLNRKGSIIVTEKTIRDLNKIDFFK